MLHTHLSEFHMGVTCHSHLRAMYQMDRGWSRFGDEDGAAFYCKQQQDLFASTASAQFREARSCGVSDAAADTSYDTQPAFLLDK